MVTLVWYTYYHSLFFTGGTTTNLVVSLVYVHKPYYTAVDVTVRRNLVYNFRSLLARDTKGQVLAGLYFLVSATDCPEFTLFYEQASIKRKTKYKFSQFTNPEEVRRRDNCNIKIKTISIHKCIYFCNIKMIICLFHHRYQSNFNIRSMSAVHN